MRRPSRASSRSRRPKVLAAGKVGRARPPELRFEVEVSRGQLARDARRGLGPGRADSGGRRAETPRGAGRQSTRCPSGGRGWIPVRPGRSACGRPMDRVGIGRRGASGWGATPRRARSTIGSASTRPCSRRTSGWASHSIWATPLRAPLGTVRGDRRGAGSHARWSGRGGSAFWEHTGVGDDPHEAGTYTATFERTDAAGAYTIEVEATRSGGTFRSPLDAYSGRDPDFRQSARPRDLGPRDPPTRGADGRCGRGW